MMKLNKLPLSFQRKLESAFFLSIALFAIPSQASAQSARFVDVVAVVNGEIISTKDLDGRIGLLAASAGIPVDGQTRPMLGKRAYDALVEDQVKLAEAKKNGVEIAEAEVTKTVSGMEKGDAPQAKSLRQLLSSKQIDADSLRQQVRADMAWARLVRRKAGPDMNITQTEIDQAMAAAKKEMSRPRYLLSEIVVDAGDKRDPSGLVERLREDPRFGLYAVQFSQSASAAKGGSLGWVNADSLDSKLRQALAKMKPDEVSDPIRVGGEYYIIKLHQAFDPKTDKPKPPTEAQIREMLERQKLEAFAARYLQRLRQSAVIDKKDKK